MYLMHICVTTSRECPQQVQRCRRLRVGAQHFLRIRNARIGGEIQIVDDVTAVAGQFHTIDGFGIGRARFRKLAGHPAQLDHRHLGTMGQDNRHLQQHFESVTNRIRAELLKAFSAIAALQQECFAASRCCKMPLQPVRLAAKNQEWITCKLCLYGIQGRLIRIVRHLDSRFIAPA